MVTGDLERVALAESLQAAFSGRGLDFLEPRQVDGMTSKPLPPLTAVTTPSTVQKFSKALIAELMCTGGRRTRPHFVVGVDDLELANRHQPDVVVAWVRRGLQEVIQERWSQPADNAEVMQRLREQCSFHLLALMPEAYFFGDPAALATAGVSATQPPSLAGPDVEQLVVTDQDPRWLRRVSESNGGHHAGGRLWWDENRHAKRYLDHLCEMSYSTYSETIDGAAALRGLNWPSAVDGLRSCQFARSLFHDLSWLTGVGINPLGATGTTHACTSTGPTTNPSALMLRNI